MSMLRRFLINVIIIVGLVAIGFALGVLVVGAILR